MEIIFETVWWTLQNAIGILWIYLNFCASENTLKFTVKNVKGYIRNFSQKWLLPFLYDKRVTWNEPHFKAEFVPQETNFLYIYEYLFWKQCQSRPKLDGKNHKTTPKKCFFFNTLFDNKKIY